MSNSYYNHTTYPGPYAPGSSAAMRAELQKISVGFDKLPTLAEGASGQVVLVGPGGTSLVTSFSLASLVVASSTINSTPIGQNAPAAGSFTALNVSGAATLGNDAHITGGSINATPIGQSTRAAGNFTTVNANSGITGSLTGNVTGNVSGNVTGNLTGNVTGNVTAASGESTFYNVKITGQLDMDAGTTATIINLSSPVNAGDAATKGYVDGRDALKLDLAGGMMSGDIAMGTNRITGLADPINAQDAATKAYADGRDALKLNLSGGTMSGGIAMGSNRITGLADPLNPQDAASKGYVDTAVQGLDAKGSCRTATTANITLSGLQTVGGVALVAGNRVLVKNQTNAAQNGLYVVAAGAWTRAEDANTWDELTHAYTFVEDGSAANNGFVCTVQAGGTLGTTAVTWQQFSGAGQIDAGAGMSKTGNRLDVGTASSSRIVVNADDIDLAQTGVSASTYRSVTVDEYGRVTAGSNPTDLAGYGITDAYTKTETNAALDQKLNLAGGTMTGPIAMGGQKVTGLGEPTADTDAATRKFVNDGLAGKLSLTGGTLSGGLALGGNKVTGVGAPSDSQDVTNKGYVDAILGSATSAANSAYAAAQSAVTASTHAGTATTKAGEASASALAAANSLDDFEEKYLGAHALDPTLDNDGNALQEGALYWSTIAKIMKIYDGSAWTAAYVPAAGYVQKTGDTMTGALTAPGFTGPLAGNAATATKLATSRTISLTGDASGSTSFDGSANASITVTVGALANKLDSSQKGAAGGVAPLDSNGHVPAVNLPSYVDDVLEYANQGALPNPGETGKIYVTLDNNKTWRWGGSAYVEISASPGSTDAVPEGSSNLYFTVARVRTAVLAGLSLATNAAITASDTVLSAFGKLQKQVTDLDSAKAPKANPTFTGTVSGITKSHVGLGNVDNTSDANKPASTAVANALAGKQATLVSGTNIKTIGGESILGSGDVVLPESFATGDTLTTARTLSAPDWLLTDGAAYLRSAYPDLAMLLPAISKLPDPASLPTSTGRGCAFSPDGTYLSVAHDTSPFVTIYKRSGDTFTKLANPADLPTSTGRGCAFSPDGTYLSVAHSSSPFVTIYKRSGDTFTKLANPADLPTSTGRGCAFSPDGTYLSVAHSNSPFVTIYKRSGDTFTKLPDPTALPTNHGNGCAFSPDGTYLSVAHWDSPNITIYKRSGDTFTKLANPADLPTSAGYGCAFSPDGTYLSVAHQTSPLITIYKRSGDTFTKLANPADLPTSTGYGCAFSPDGTYLSVAHGNSPFVTIYKRSGDTFTKLPDPTALPTNHGNGCAFSPDGTYLSVAHQTSPFIAIYTNVGDEGDATSFTTPSISFPKTKTYIKT